MPAAGRIISRIGRSNGLQRSLTRRRPCRCELALQEHVLHLPAGTAEDDAADSHDAAGDAPAGYGQQATVTTGHVQQAIYTPPPILDPKSKCSGYYIEPVRVGLTTCSQGCANMGPFADGVDATALRWLNRCRQAPLSE